MRFGTYYFLQGYVVCPSPETIEATALRGMPMLNSLLRGPVDQLARSRDIYVKAPEKAGRTGAMLCWMNFGGLPQDRVSRSMELFAREVMPRFR